MGHIGLMQSPNPWKIEGGLSVAEHRRSQYEANRGTPASVKFYQILSIFIFFIRLIILEDFIRLISYNGPCVRLGCSFFLATALQRFLVLPLLLARLGHSVAFSRLCCSGTSVQGTPWGLGQLCPLIWGVPWIEVGWGLLIINHRFII